MNQHILWTVTALGLAASGFALGALLCGLARRLAPRWGLVDHPGGHKGHREPTPLGGGVAIWATTLAILVLGTLVVAMGGGRVYRIAPATPHRGALDAGEPTQDDPGDC